MKSSVSRPRQPHIKCPAATHTSDSGIGSSLLVLAFLIDFSYFSLSFKPSSNLSQQCILVCIEAASPSSFTLLVIRLLHLSKLGNCHLQFIWTKQVWKQNHWLWMNKQPGVRFRQKLMAPSCRLIHLYVYRGMRTSGKQVSQVREAGSERPCSAFKALHAMKGVKSTQNYCPLILLLLLLNYACCYFC